MAAKQKPEDAVKSGRVMLLSVSTLYIVSIALILVLLPANKITPDESPLVQSMSIIGLSVFVHILNGVLIIAGFSTMVASLYAITSMLVKLGEDGDAPKLLTKTLGKLKMPIYALMCTATGLILSTLLAFLLPKNCLNMSQQRGVLF